MANASRVVELAGGRGIPLERIYVDALIFPASVDAAFGTTPSTHSEYCASGMDPRSGSRAA